MRDLLGEPRLKLQASITSLSSVLSADFKKEDIEVGIITRDDPKFRRLSVEEIDHYLMVIAEKD